MVIKRKPEGDRAEDVVAHPGPDHSGLSTAEYIDGSKHGGDGPSNGMRHDACEHRAQTILATEALDNQGRGILDIRGSYGMETTTRD
jgi:hypothetical protein